jgi:hypothetical protein
MVSGEICNRKRMLIHANNELLGKLGTCLQVVFPKLPEFLKAISLVQPLMQQSKVTRWDKTDGKPSFPLL